METKLCKYCQSQIPKKAKVCPICKRKLTHPVIGIIIAVIGVMVFIAAASSALSGGNKSNGSDNSFETQQESENKDTITLDEFNQIETGMTYEEICAIVGSEGTVMSEVQVGDLTTTMYSWYAENGISNANVTIQDGKVTAKALVGLE